MAEGACSDDVHQQLHRARLEIKRLRDENATLKQHQRSCCCAPGTEARSGALVDATNLQAVPAGQPVAGPATPAKRLRLASRVDGRPAWLCPSTASEEAENEKRLDNLANHPAFTGVLNL